MLSQLACNATNSAAIGSVCGIVSPLAFGLLADGKNSD